MTEAPDKLAEILNRREEYVAKAAMAGLTYDWYDHTFNNHGDVSNPKIYDPDTMELLAECGQTGDKYAKVVQERAKQYGGSGKTQPPDGENGTDT
jgi:hypothetical protein